MKKGISICIILVLLFSSFIVGAEPIKIYAEDTKDDILLMNEQLIYNKQDNGERNYSKKGYTYSGYSYDEHKGKKEVYLGENGEKIEFSHGYIEKTNDTTGKKQIIIDDFDGSLFVTNDHIYYVSTKYTQGEYYNDCWDGVDYVRTDLNGKNREVLYHDDYVPFGTGIGEYPSYLVTSEYIYISKYNIERVNLTTKKHDTVCNIDINERTGSDWITLNFVINDNYYFYLSDNQQGEPNNENLPDLCNGYFKYNREKGLEYIFEIDEYISDETYWNDNGDGTQILTRKNNFVIKKAGFNDVNYNEEMLKESDNSFTYKEESPFTANGIYFTSTNNGSRIEWFYSFNSSELTKIISQSHSSFKCGTKKYSGDCGFYYKDSYFDNDSSEYNHSLATMSLCMALSSYNNHSASDTDYSNADKNIYDLLKKCGFTDYAEYSYTIKPSVDSVACAIASKDLNDNTKLIAIAVRSGGYEKEWSSNMHIGLSNDHTGFDDSSKKVLKDIKNYISDLGIKGNAKFWITGFSRGAAVATQTAAKLNELKIDGLSFDKSKIFAYGFATPAGALKSNNPTNSDYNNIFNIIHYADIVPLIAPGDWNFLRYGQTYMFPFSESNSKSSVYEQKMIEYLENNLKAEYKVDEFAVTYSIADNDSLGTFNRKLIKSMSRTIGSRVLYVSVYEKQMMNIMKNDSTIGKVGTAWTSNYTTMNSILILLGYQTVLHPFLTSTLMTNLDKVAVVHSEDENYMAWMQSMDSNYVNESQPLFSNGDYRVVKINCPVDINVYDSKKKLVASIKNDIPQKIENSCIISSIDENDQKIIYLPADEKYTIDIIAREDCKTSYTINECTGVNSDVSRIVSYSSVKIMKGDKLSGTLNAYSGDELNNTELNGSSVEYDLKHNEDVLTSTLNISGDDVEKYTYSVTTNVDEAKGSVNGGGVFNYGDFCKVTVTPKGNNEFYGWYIDGKKVSSDLEYRFEVNDNIKITAAFEKQYDNNLIMFVIFGVILFVVLVVVIILVQKKRNKNK